MLTVILRYFWDKLHHDLLFQADNPRWYHSNWQEKSGIPAEFLWYGIHIGNRSAESIPAVSPFQLGTYHCSLSNPAVLIAVSTNITSDSSAFDECTNLNYINGKKVTIIPPKNQYPLFDGELHDFVINQFGRSNNVGFMNIYTSAFASKVVSDYTNSSMNDTQKAKALHDWLCDAVDYDHETTSDLKNHVDYSAFLYSTTVCDGYARAYYLLTKAAGIESYFVVKSGVHGWNIIKLGDHYFHVDATWDDGKGVGNRKYDYFLLSDSQVEALGGAHSSWSLSCPTILFTYDYGPVPLSNYMLGDINKDGTIDATDLILLQNYLLGNGSINKGDAILADLNYDGVVDTFDLVVLRQKFNKQ